MNKKILKNIKLVSVLFASSILTVGCFNKKTSDSSSDDQPTDAITLDSESIELILGEQYKLQPKITTTATGSITLTYKSLNTSVATVDSEGVITSLKVGRTTIEMSFGKATAKVDVAVTLGDYRPYIRFENIFSSEITVDLGTSIDVSAYVFFNSNKYYTDLGYSLSNLTSGEINEDHIYTPSKVGKFSVTVCGEFNNYSLEDLTLTINVVNNVEFSLTRQGEVQEISTISLCSVSQYKEYSYQNSVVVDGSVYEGGVKKSVDSISLTDNADGAVSFDVSTKKLTATGVGKGTASLLLSYKDKTGVINTKKYPIYVDYPLVPYENEPIQEVGVKNGVFDSETIFASFPAGQRKIVEARSVDSKTTYEVDADGKIHGLEENFTKVQSILLGNGYILQEVKYLSYAGIISQAEDLNMFNTASKTGDYKDILNLKITGKYIVTNDIDASGFTLNEHDRIAGDGLGAFTGCGFMGEFDGRGHTISNLTFSKGGIFSAIGSGAYIHAIGFENAKYDSYSLEDRHVLATYINNATIENLYVHIDKLSRTNAAGVICHDMNMASSFTNALIVVDDIGFDITNNPNGYGTFSSFGNARKTYGSAPGTYFKDTYFVSPAPLVKGQSYTNTKFDNAYYCDVESVNYDLTYHYVNSDEKIDTNYTIPKFVVPNAKHYLTLSSFKSARNDYSSFNTDYWDVTTGLAWKA